MQQAPIATALVHGLELRLSLPRAKMRQSNSTRPRAAGQDFYFSTLMNERVFWLLQDIYMDKRSPIGHHPWMTYRAKEKGAQTQPLKHLKSLGRPSSETSKMVLHGHNPKNM